MNKIFLKDMEIEKIKYLLSINKKLEDRLSSDYQEYLLEAQYYQAMDILGKNYHDYITYHDHYNSFYFTLKDYRKFLINLQADYLSQNNIILYKKLIKKLDVLDSMDVYSDNYNNLETWIENNAKILLDDVTECLREYEKIPNIDDVLEYHQEMENLNGYYIEMRNDGSTDNIVRLNVAYTEIFI